MKTVTITEDKIPKLFVDHDGIGYVEIPITTLLQTGQLYYKPNDGKGDVGIVGMGFIKSGVRLEVFQLENGTMRIDARSQKGNETCFSGEFPPNSNDFHSLMINNTTPETFTLNEGTGYKPGYKPDDNPPTQF